MIWNEIYDYYFGYQEQLSAWVVEAAIATAGIVSSLIGQARQNKANRRLAREQNTANELALQKQLEYDKPASQMMRYQDAGLNPNLVYGQGTPGNQSQPLTYPDIAPTNMSLPDVSALMNSINQTRMTGSQISANDAKTHKTYIESNLLKLQKKVLERDPRLNEKAYDAMISTIIANASIKGSESGLKSLEYGIASQPSTWRHPKTGKQRQGPAAAQKFELDIALLEKKYNLMNVDQSIKAEILDSKEFQNDMNEIQRKWMEDFEMTSDHFYKLGMLIIQWFLNSK